MIDSTGKIGSPEASPSQFNKGGSIYIPLIFGLDTLFIGFYIQEFILSDTEWQSLAENKEKAKASVFQKGGTLIEFQGKHFSIQAAGKSPYTYVLVSNDLTVKIALKPSRLKFPEIYVEFRSQFLWGGYKDAYLLVREWIESWTVIVKEVISRADLTVDIQGTPVFSLENIVSKSRRREEIYKVFSTGSEITGYRFGSSPILCRIYNKAEEIKSKSGKTWFHELWINAGWNCITPVWRVEFQLIRAILKEYKIDSFNDLQNALADIWRYLTAEWFTLRQKGSEDTNKTRWPLLPFWQIVQGMTENFGTIAGIDRYKLSEPKVEVLIPQIIGLLTTTGALLGEKTKEGTIKKVISLSDKYLKSQETNFDDELRVKKKKHSLFERPYQDAEEK